MNYTCIYFIGHLRHHFPTNRIPDNINYIWSFLIFCQLSVLQNYSFIHIFQICYYEDIIKLGRENIFYLTVC